MVDPQFEQQLKTYEVAVQHFHQQKFVKAKELLEKVQAGPSKELADRARVHLRIVEQRMAKQPAPSVRTPEEHYQAGVAMMNLGRWDEARSICCARASWRPRPTTYFTRWRRWIV